MDREMFVSGVRTVVHAGGVRVASSILSDPPKVPTPEQVALSNWYKKLSLVDKDNVLKVAALAADCTLFKFFCVLDGVAFVENSHEKGEFELFFVKKGQRTRLNGPGGEELHNLFAATRS
jgi:hypothetical protein